jgi:hypothetical protein
MGIDAQCRSSGFVLAEMNTHHFMFRGAGVDRDSARNALLNAWTRHREDLLARYPDRATTVPPAQDMEQHFRIHYLDFALDGGYRDGERIA